ncbi:MAG: flagellar biosynthesis anti-sigma factor FlgM, partial [Clostridia bacterium]|nr:flagellar biosynthesis anti-sigma factor FlgM [Clostridia bacterium]
RTGSAGGAAAGGGRDTVDFSPAAQQLLRSRGAGVDPQRAAQIEAIRRRLQAGTYRVSGEEVARAWLRRLVADQVAQRLETSSAQSGSSGSGGGDAAPRP